MLPLATVAVLAMTGTKLPASLSCLKKSRPSLTLSSVAAVRRQAGRPDGGLGLVRRERVTEQRDLLLVLGLQQVGPVLRDVGDDLGVDLERHDAVVVAVPHAVGRLGRVRDACPRSRPCTAGRGPGRRPAGRRRGRRRRRPAPAGPGLSLLATIAASSSFEPPPGLSPLIGIPYFAVKPSMAAP